MTQRPLSPWAIAGTCGASWCVGLLAYHLAAGNVDPWEIGVGAGAAVLWFTIALISALRP